MSGQEGRVRREEANHNAQYLSQVQQQRIKMQAPHFTFDDDSVCSSCNRRLGTR